MEQHISKFRTCFWLLQYIRNYLFEPLDYYADLEQIGCHLFSDQKHYIC